MGQDGGEFQSGSLSLSIPPGALDNNHKISAHFLFNTELTLSTDTPDPQLYSVFSPILAFQPHDLCFMKPVSIRFPFTAMLKGWMLELRREEPGNACAWTPVLTIDTDLRDVIRKDNHCSYDVDTSLLELHHFCSYFWCGFKKEKASLAVKTLACLFFARMDSSGRSCNFVLHLSDNCQDVVQVCSMSRCFGLASRSFISLICLINHS